MDASTQLPYVPTHPIRIVTAASLFDGHDAAIHIMRRILQSSGAEVIHLGHNRSVQEVVRCAIEEDAQGIAMTSYQGGHIEYFKYMVEELRRAGRKTKVFGGGGGTILPSEIEELHRSGVTRIFSPDDGRHLGLQGMINVVMQECDFASVADTDVDRLLASVGSADAGTLGQLITLAETRPQLRETLARNAERAIRRRIPVLGITGTGGAGKSSLVDELVRRFLREFGNEKRLAILSVDPSKRKSGGALLGDRIRMNAIDHPSVYMRSLATREANLAMSKHVADAIALCRAADFDFIIVETSGIGQSDTAITSCADATLYVMTSEYGAASQLEKIDMLDFADVIAINKFDKGGSLDALRDVRRQWKRNHGQFDAKDDAVPVYGTIASQFNDPGTTRLYRAVMTAVAAHGETGIASELATPSADSHKPSIVPPERSRYLAEIAEASDRYAEETERDARIASQLYALFGAIQCLTNSASDSILPHPPGEVNGTTATVELWKRYETLFASLSDDTRRLLRGWTDQKQTYSADELRYRVRDKEIRVPLVTKSLSGIAVRKVALPTTKDWGEVLRFLRTENLPGEFPFTGGVFPLKRVSEDPTRMFAGEGGAERTNRRFHFVSRGLPAKRLSTAFDSVTLYGEDPAKRPDIYGKIGNSGVSVATLDEAKKLYSGFDLSDPSTSVSMTINGPAPMMLGFYFQAAIDQGCEKYIRQTGRVTEVEARIREIYASNGLQRPVYRGDLPVGNDGLGTFLLGVTGDEVLAPEEYERIAAEVLTQVRGTVQADILKEDQAQNTCIFSTEFALRLMGDMQAYFIDNAVRNFYSVSISGYHIAEAGANPITQLAFTLANGFTFVEYYRSRGMAVDDFAPNFSFFFSNGLDPEYSVIGRVARRIWAKALRYVYRASPRSQMLKYHIQTSGRSLHAQEIAFNDIRTTLQALYAIYDNCNSLHTNAYDEAITTPTEESVRRALAIQLIINKELGLARNENPMQGSYITSELTDLVEQAVYAEFRRLSERGGVLGAMERMYQRTQIQEESLLYEGQKHDGTLPIIGVNTFLDPTGSPTVIPAEVIRSTEEEKEAAIAAVEAFKKRNALRSVEALRSLKTAALEGRNTFEAMMVAAKCCSLGQLSSALYEVGGQYRRNM